MYKLEVSEITEQKTRSKQVQLSLIISCEALSFRRTLMASGEDYEITRLRDCEKIPR
jgi:hypothetical protein